MTKMYRITGRVQGVGFRHFTYRTALSLGITGYVKNMTDGSVEVLAQCQSENRLGNFQQQLKNGPSFARVEDISITEIEDDRQYGDFIIE